VAQGTYKDEGGPYWTTFGDITTALSTRILGHPAVLALDLTLIEDWRKLGIVFVKAFDDSGRKYPIDFDQARIWLKYGRRGNALRTMKGMLTVDVDYICQPGQLLRAKGTRALMGSSPDCYLLTRDAFELFAIKSNGQKGDVVKRFFQLAIKKAYFAAINELEESPSTVVGEAILKRKRSLVEEQIHELDREVEGPVRMEALVRDRLALELGAVTEVRCEYGLVDVLSETEVIEVKSVGCWKHALGQCLAYGLCFMGRKVRIHLFADSGRWDHANKLLQTIRPAWFTLWCG
jgi:hypothetical protein